MTNTQLDYWSASGESLMTYAQNIVSLGPTKAPAKLRGENILIPYKRGRMWVPKIMDDRTIQLGMWVRGCNPDGSAPSGSTLRRQKFEDNWNHLLELLYTPGKQFPLTKRWYNNGSVRSATALAEYDDGLEPTMFGRHGGKCTVDLNLADPVFYDDELQTFNLVNGSQTINVKGISTIESQNIILTINGSRTNTLVRNQTLGVQVEYGAQVVSGANARIEPLVHKSTHTPASGPPFDGSGNIEHSGAPHWLSVRGGNNVIELSSDSGVGSVQLQVRGAWL